MTQEIPLKGDSPKETTEAEAAAANEACARFQDEMPDRIGAGEDLRENEHLRSCERCRALLNDLEYIVEVAGKLFPREVEPRETLWNDFEKRLANERGEA